MNSIEQIQEWSEPDENMPESRVDSRHDSKLADLKIQWNPNSHSQSPSIAEETVSPLEKIPSKKSKRPPHKPDLGPANPSQLTPTIAKAKPNAKLKTYTS